ncbi:hypothetical protein V8C44DRAFT_269620 [Trichoderma aethiopicum]
MADERPPWRIPPLRMASSHEPRSRLRLRRPIASQRQAIRDTSVGDASDISMAEASVGGDEDMAFGDSPGDEGPGDEGPGDEDPGDDEAIGDEALQAEILSALDISQLDIAAADQGVPDLDQTLLPPGFDELEFRAAAEYNDIAFSQDDFVGESDDDIIPQMPPAVQEGVGGSLMLAPNMPGSRRASDHATEDKSVLLHHTVRPDITLSDFELALGLMTHITGVSNRDWSILREVLQIPTSAGQPENRDLARLPQALATLKSQVTKMMPLLDMRMVNVDLKVDKLPTKPPSSKGEPQQQPRSDQQPQPETQSAEMHFFDPEDLFKSILSSQLRSQIHTDMAHRVDNPTELYHSRAWQSSVRTSSGHYAHFINIDGDFGDPIFPSDWVYFSCDSPDCACTSLDAPEDLDAPLPTAEELHRVSHIGRVIGFAKDFSTQRHPLVAHGDIILILQEALRPDDQRLQQREIELEPDELVLSLKVEYCIRQGSILDFCSVTLDRRSGEDLEDPSYYVDKSKKNKANDPFTKYPRRDPQVRHEDDEWIVRRILRENDELDWFCYLPSIRAEHELATYGRSWFANEWDRLAPGNADKPPPIAIPCTTFIDGFGLFRNSYRTLVGMYMTIAGLNADERRRRANTLPILLSPHGSVFEDAIDALRCFIPLDKGIVVDINGAPTLMCVFTLCYVGDMLQQNQNAGCLGPTAGKFCRFCYIGKKNIVTAFEEFDPGHLLDFDIDQHARYSHQVSEMRRFAGSLSAKQKQDYCSQWGLTMTPSNLEKISPALDPIWTRVPDAAHSEYNGLTNLFHTILIKVVLRPQAVKDYSRRLRSWKFPPGWNRLQSPVHYLGSYSLSEHARWSVIIPGLLNVWLEKDFINPNFWNAAVMRPELDGLDLVDWLVRAFARLARSNDLLMGNNRRLRKKYEDDSLNIVLQARHDYQMMCVWASWELQKGRSRRASQASSVSSSQSIQSDFTQTLQRRVREQDERGLAADEFEILLRNALVREAPPPPVPTPDRRRRGKPSWKQQDGDDKSVWLTNAMRPNVHAGNHLLYFYDEYAMLSNIDVLIGESEHKWFKAVVYQTNLKDVERVLLGKVNLQLVCRLFILGAFNTTHPVLANQIRRVWKACPTLFDRILSRSDRPIAIEDSDLEHQDMFEDVDRYTGITATGRIKRTAVSQTRHAVNENEGLPSSAGGMTQTFRTLLRSAYANDYDIPNIYTLSRSGSFFWYNKFSFTDLYASLKMH